MGDLRLVGGTVICMDDERRVLQHGEVGLSGGRISYVGPARDKAVGEVLDTTGQAVLPGLINAHTHAAMTLMRSAADDMPLKEWLETKIWPLEAHLTGNDVYWGSQLGAVEMLRAGVTCFHDMYWFAPEATRGGLDAGMRVCPSGVLIGVHPQAEEMFREAVDFVDACLAEDNPRCHIRFGPHAPYTVPDAYLERVIAAALERDVPVHIHLAETAFEVSQSVEVHGETPARHMDRVGLFEPHCCAAHCVHLDQAEVELLAERKVGILASHTSNLKLGCGIVPLPDLQAAGAIIGLGTDGTASNNNLDVLEEARLAALLHKGVRRDPTVITAGEALWMATRGGAEAIGVSDLGKLEVGCHADLICLDLQAPHLSPGHDVIADLIYAAQASDVATAIVEGEIVMRDRKLTLVDETEVMAKARECALGLLANGR